MTGKDPKGTVSRHLIANIAGRSWAFVSMFLFVPVYIRLLGLENFGVIALFLAIAGLIAFLDMGLSATLATDLHDQRHAPEHKLDLLRTYELTYAAVVAVVIAVALLVPAEVYSVLLSAADAAKPAVAASMRLIFVAAALQMLFNFYIAGLIGVEAQISANVLLVVCGLVRSALVILPLYFLPTPVVYLLWQVVTVMVFAWVARRLLQGEITPHRGASRGSFRWSAVTQNGGFTGGLFLVSVTAAINTQADKLFISKLNGMAALAEYSLATTFSQLLVFVVSPITLTLLPRIVRARTSAQSGAVRDLYVIAQKLVFIIVCAALGCMLFFGPYLVGVWSASVQPATIAPYLPALVVGYALLAISTVPHGIATAHKNMKGSMRIGFSVLLTIPCYWYAVGQLGPLGAALTWLVLQMIVVPLYGHWVLRTFFEAGAVPMGALASAFFLPLTVSLLLNFLASQFVSVENGHLANLAIVLGTAVLCTVCCAALALRSKDISFLREFSR